MQLEILDTKHEGKSICFLTKASLYEYLSSLEKDFDKFEIQRGIVSNFFLDKLIDTILSKNAIPIIVLVSENASHKIIKQNGKEYLKVSNFNILDGLQRSYRLKQIWNAIEFFSEEIKKKKNELLKISSRISLSLKYSKALQEKEIPSALFYKLIEFYKSNKNVDFTKLLSENNQWFEVWVDLEGDKQIEKMLILNAGHKQVNIRHQLELLFLSLIPKLREIEKNKITIYREKEKDALSYGKERKKGQFHFSHLISSVLSIIEEKPLTTNTKLVQKIQGLSADEEEIYGEYFNYNFFKELISFLMKIDDRLTKLGYEKWIGREAVLTGIFGSMGEYAKSHSVHIKDVFALLVEKLDKNPEGLNLKEYDKQNSELQASKINIGSVHRKVVYSGIHDFLLSVDKKYKINWSKYFIGYKNNGN